jgi:dimethylamine monooxygenase subunit A
VPGLSAAGEKARYFPVEPTPLRMQAGLLRLGVDLGNGEADARFFQRDHERARYLAAKRTTPPDRHGLAGDDAHAAQARDAALRWMRETLTREDPGALREADADRDARDPLEALARAVQEDLAVLALDPDAAEPTDARLVAYDVRFPSGWRPERLAGASFARIHAPVPGFAKDPRAARSMVGSMLGRGPYVRFVWTLSADDALDHHPDAGQRRGWEDASRAWLRVERQVTVPLPEAGASVFLIRTYLEDVAALDPRQREVLREAVRVMPEDVRAYKNIPAPGAVERFLRAEA